MLSIGNELRALGLSSLRWSLCVSAALAVFACGSPDGETDWTGGASGISGSPGDDAGAPEGGTFGDSGTGDCKGTGEGCPCPQGAAPVACWTGPQELRGQSGCKDGTSTCQGHGEFSAWGPCVGQVTTCAPGDAAAPAVDAPISVDYTGCAALPAAGKRGYGQCDDGQVVVIVNDGTAQEMTCCPVGPNVLSTVAAERNVLRTGLCQADEVATGMESPTTPGVYCTKVNTLLKLSAPTTARYVSGAVPGVLGQIAASYNQGDTCICDEGTVVIGGHTATDNTCADQCVAIETK